MTGVVHEGTFAARGLKQATILVPDTVISVVDATVAESDTRQRKASVGEGYGHEAAFIAALAKAETTGTTFLEATDACRNLRGHCLDLVQQVCHGGTD